LIQMAGLNLKMGVGLSGMEPAAQPSYSNDGINSVTEAAFGPGATIPVASGPMAYSPPVGMSVAVGILAVVALAMIRHSLPN
jgi:hypothetical protein